VARVVNAWAALPEAAAIMAVLDHAEDPKPGTTNTHA
jgi:hypothetical protein